MSRKTGRLLVVATPIGNLEDVTARAVRVLREADVVAAEDTRHTRPLLHALGLDRPLVSLHEHNEARASADLLARMAAGETVALVSDAGTPLVSDPGQRLVAAAHDAGIPVVAIPGPSALTAALSVAGLGADRFVFEGFLPARAGARRTRLAALAPEARTLVFFEAPHRLVASLVDAAAVLGAGRVAVLARELTKRFETVLVDSLGGLAARVAADADQQRGECVLVVAGAPAGEAATATASPEQVVSVLLEDLPPARAAALAAKLTGRPKRELYEIAMRLGGAARP